MQTFFEAEVKYKWNLILMYIHCIRSFYLLFTIQNRKRIKLAPPRFLNQVIQTRSNWNLLQFTFEQCCLQGSTRNSFSSPSGKSSLSWPVNPWELELHPSPQVTPSTARLGSHTGDRIPWYGVSDQVITAALNTDSRNSTTWRKKKFSFNSYSEVWYKI